MASRFEVELTVAAIVEQRDRFLMVEELVFGQQVINQPAGHVEHEEAPFDAVIRETREETAWDFTPTAICGIYLWQHPNADRHFLRISYCGTVRNHHPSQPLDDGILRATWFDRDELLRRGQQLRSPMVMRSIDDYLAGTRLPCDSIRHLLPDELSKRATLVA